MFSGSKPGNGEEVSRLHQGRISDGASEGREEVLAQELLPMLPVQQAINVSGSVVDCRMLLGACN